MSYRDMAMSHVIQGVREAFCMSEVVLDHDGDIPMTGPHATYWLTVRGDGKRVRAWGFAVMDVKPTAALLREVNNANSSLELCRVLWDNGAVVVVGIAPVENLTGDALGELCCEVEHTLASVGEMIHAVYGGELPRRMTCSDEADHDSEF